MAKSPTNSRRCTYQKEEKQFIKEAVFSREQIILEYI